MDLFSAMVKRLDGTQQKSTLKKLKKRHPKKSLIVLPKHKPLFSPAVFIKTRLRYTNQLNNKTFNFSVYPITNRYKNHKKT